jgi:hypothetical protein
MQQQQQQQQQERCDGGVHAVLHCLVLGIAGSRAAGQTYTCGLVVCKALDLNR